MNVNLTVRDIKTGTVYTNHGETDFSDLVGEKWAKDLLHCDMCCFAITQCNTIMLLDEVGHYAMPPDGRFEIVSLEYK